MYRAIFSYQDVEPGTERRKELIFAAGDPPRDAILAAIRWHLMGQPLYGKLLALKIMRHWVGGIDFLGKSESRSGPTLFEWKCDWVQGLMEYLDEKYPKGETEHVSCSRCRLDYTMSTARGGLLVRGVAVCPQCAPHTLEALKDNHLEDGVVVCPEDESFYNFVRRER